MDDKVVQKDTVNTGMDNDNKVENTAENTAGVAEKAQEKIEEKTEDKIEEKQKEKTEDKPEEKKEEKKEEKAANMEGKEKPKKKSKKGLIAILAAALILGCIVLCYGGIALYYQTHFFKHSIVNGIDCSNMTAEQVAAMIDLQAQEYFIDIIGRNEQGEKHIIGTIQAEDIAMELPDTLYVVEQLIHSQNELFWITSLGNDVHSYEVVNAVSFDTSLLQQKVKGFDACKSQNMVKPQDAYISEYSTEKKQYEIIPETAGTSLKLDAVLEAVEAAIVAQSDYVDLMEAECYLKADVTSENKDLTNAVTTVNKWLGTNITYDWNGNEVIVDSDLINEWISFEGKKAVLDEEAVAEFVTANAKQYDTYGKTRKFTTTLGVELSLPSGAFGWKTDREGETEELKKRIYAGSVEDREPLYICRGAQKGSNDIGSSYVEADLTNQHLYLYQKGTLVFETDFVSGVMTQADCITPYGVFGLTYKTTNAVLRGANYETPVNYWMPFHGNFGMHDATWRTEFGGTIYLTNGSHGCINLPLESAAVIYSYVSTGFPVICYYY